LDTDLYEPGSPARKGGVVHFLVVFEIIIKPESPVDNTTKIVLIENINFKNF